MAYINEREAFFKPASAEVRAPGNGPTIDKLTQMYGMQSALDGRIVAERGIERYVRVGNGLNCRNGIGNRRNPARS